MSGRIPIKGSVFFKQFITILQHSQQPKDMVMLNRMVILAIGQMMGNSEVTIQQPKACPKKDS